MYKIDQYEIHPEGVYQAVVVRWEDLGLKETQYGEKHRAVIKYESLSAMRRDGKPFLIWDFVNVAYSSQAKLVERYQQITGSPLLGDEFNPEDLLGIHVKVIIVHNSDQSGRTYEVFFFYCATL